MPLPTKIRTKSATGFDVSFAAALPTAIPVPLAVSDVPNSRLDNASPLGASISAERSDSPRPALADAPLGPLPTAAIVSTTTPSAAADVGGDHVTDRGVRTAPVAARRAPDDTAAAPGDVTAGAVDDPLAVLRDEDLGAAKSCFTADEERGECGCGLDTVDPPESPVSANATAGIHPIAAPTPNATARPPIRPT